MQHAVFTALRVLGISGGSRALAVVVLTLGVIPIGFDIVSDALKFCMALLLTADHSSVRAKQNAY